EHDADVDVAGIRGEDELLGQRGRAVAALDPQHRAHGPMLDETNSGALEYADRVVVRADAVSPRVGAVVDDDGVPAGSRDVHAVDLEPREPSGLRVDLEHDVLVRERRVRRDDGALARPSRTQAIEAIAERRDLGGDDDPAARR